MATKKSSRREFIKLAAASTVVAGVAPTMLGTSRAEVLRSAPRKPVALSDTVRIATIGMGIIGFIDTATALRVPGVELVAAADCYDGRLVRTKEVHGMSIDTTRDYREILARSDVDAVLVCVPDHWHARIAIEAMEAGKAVYCEKPMVHDLEEGPQMIEAQRRTGKALQVGSQYASSILYEKARRLYESGAIGQVNLVEATTNRNSAIGAWQYSIPPDASTDTIDWDTFQGDAPKRPFDAKRFFQWRGYGDYGTGVAGDLFVHLFTGIHHVLQSHGPTSVVAMGGLRFWKDGRDMPDVTLALFDYPETENHAPFTLALQSNFVDGSGGGSVFRFIGDEGVITVQGDGLTVSRSPRRRPPDEAVFRGYNSVRTFSEAQQQAFIEAYREAHPVPDPAETSETSEYEAPRGYDSRLDHFTYFFDSVRNGTPVYEDAVYGYRAAAPSLLCNQSYREHRILHWDPEAMELKT
ncbi:MAG: Gfo/Idh/MocA family oxidoreductase [Rhodothermales bacterium]